MRIKVETILALLEQTSMEEILSD